MNFTDELLLSLTAERPQQEFYDSAWSGRGSFGVRVNRGRGEKVFFLLYSREGKRRRYPIGRFPTISVDEARGLAADIGTRVAQGEDPSALRKLSQTPLEEVAKLYLDSRPLSPKTRAEYERLLTQELFPLLRARSLESITERELRRILHRLAEERAAPALANRVRALLHAFYEYGIEAGLVGENLISRIAPTVKEEAKRKRRIQRTLPFELIQQLYLTALESEGTSGSLVQFALLSGISAPRIRSLRWSDLRGDFYELGGTLIHLTPHHRKILELSRNGSDFIFSADGRRPIQNAQTLLGKLRRDTGESLNWSEVAKSIQHLMLKSGIPYSELALVYAEHRRLEPPDRSLKEWASRRIFTEWSNLLTSSGPEDRGKIIRLRRLTRLK